MSLKTKRDLPFATRGGLPFTIPKGAALLPIPWDRDRFWVDPFTFPVNSIEHHDATYYGVAVLKEEAEP